ncbi:MAG: AsmA family protein [Magnetospirillum gryphiswaldense]|nr:AsmA family protein [Magnetospirillum gryphiswaldense]
MRMKTAIKAAAAAAAVVAVVMIAASKSVDFERYKGYLSELVLAETGRKLTFGGPVRLRLGLVPSLIAEKVSLSNVDSGSSPEMITIERVEAEVALPALLRKEILIQRLIVSSPDILLEKGNWRLADHGDTGKATTPTRFNLRELKIKNARIRWDDGDSIQQMALHKLVVVPEQAAGGGLRVTAVGDAVGKYFELSGTLGNLGLALSGKPFAISLKGSMPGTIVSVEGAVASLPDLTGLDFKLGLQADELAETVKLVSGHALGSLGPLRLSARLSDSGGALGLGDVDASAGRRDTLFVTVKGGIRDLRAMSGLELLVQAESEDLGRLSPILGAAVPPLRAVKLATALRDGKDGWMASDLKLHVGGSDLAGEAVLSQGKRAKLKATLNATRLDVADFAGKAANGNGAAGGRVLPDAAVPAQILRDVDADLSLRADKLVMGGVPFSAVSAKAQLHQGVLSLDPVEGGVAGGRFDGSLSLDARTDRPAATLRLDARDVDFGRLLRDGGLDLLQGGDGSLAVSLRGRGQDVRAMAASANGSVLLRLGGGEVRNRAFGWAGGDVVSQVLGVLNPLAQSRDTTKLSCAVVHFRLKDGMAATDRGIAVQSDGVDVVGSGTVNLGDESLDLGFTPRAKEGLGLSVGGQLAGFTRLRGTLAAPQLSVDEIGAAKTALSVGAAAATGGLSLLGELLLDKVTADSDPCRTALAMGGTPSKKGGGGFFEGLFSR